MAENVSRRTTQYNLLGRFIADAKGEQGWATMAREGGYDRMKLRRVMESVPLRTLPDIQLLEGVAKALGCEPQIVLRFALEAWGESASIDLAAEYTELMGLARRMSNGELLLLLDYARRTVQIRTAADPVNHLQPRAEVRHRD